MDFLGNDEGRLYMNWPKLFLHHHVYRQSTGSGVRRWKGMILHAVSIIYRYAKTRRYDQGNRRKGGSREVG